jgi:hypothetical protein
MKQFKWHGGKVQLGAIGIVEPEQIYPGEVNHPHAENLPEEEPKQEAKQEIKQEKPEPIQPGQVINKEYES